MKISKLFHWLYAILMLLPVVVFIPTAFYYGFNEHAIAQEKTEQIPVYYESNDVTQASDLVVGNVYTYTYHTVNKNQVILCEKIWVLGNYIDFNDYPTNTRPYIATLSSNRNLFADIGSAQYRQKELTSGTIDFVYKSLDNYIEFEYITKCENLHIKEYQPVTTNMSITDSMSYAWDSVWQNDLFSWTYDSFLTEPFLYITDLFNVPANNTLVYCLSYWLNLSIIWLTFDVIMYVPLLVHRWLDKGIVE